MKLVGRDFIGEIISVGKDDRVGYYKVYIPELIHLAGSDGIIVVDECNNYWYTSSSAGKYGSFLPLQKGTKVVVRFKNNNINSGYIDRIFSYELPGNSKSNHPLYFLLINTPANNKIEIDDKNKTFDIVYFGGKGKISFSNSALDIIFNGNLNIKASQIIKIEGSQVQINDQIPSLNSPNINVNKLVDKLPKKENSDKVSLTLNVLSKIDTSNVSVVNNQELINDSQVDGVSIVSAETDSNLSLASNLDTSFNIPEADLKDLDESYGSEDYLYVKEYNICTNIDDLIEVNDNLYLKARSSLDNLEYLKKNTDKELEDFEKGALIENSLDLAFATNETLNSLNDLYTDSNYVSLLDSNKDEINSALTDIKKQIVYSYTNLNQVVNYTSSDSSSSSTTSYLEEYFKNNVSTPLSAIITDFDSNSSYTDSSSIYYNLDNTSFSNYIETKEVYSKDSNFSPYIENTKKYLDSTYEIQDKHLKIHKNLSNSIHTATVSVCTIDDEIDNIDKNVDKLTKLKEDIESTYVVSDEFDYTVIANRKIDDYILKSTQNSSVITGNVNNITSNVCYIQDNLYFDDVSKSALSSLSKDVENLNQNKNDIKNIDSELKNIKKEKPKDKKSLLSKLNKTIKKLVDKKKILNTLKKNLKRFIKNSKFAGGFIEKVFDCTIQQASHNASSGNQCIPPLCQNINLLKYNLHLGLNVNDLIPKFNIPDISINNDFLKCIGLSSFKDVINLSEKYGGSVGKKLKNIVSSATKLNGALTKFENDTLKNLFKMKVNLNLTCFTLNNLVNVPPFIKNIIRDEFTNIKGATVNLNLYGKVSALSGLKLELNKNFSSIADINLNKQDLKNFIPLKKNQKLLAVLKPAKKYAIKYVRKRAKDILKKVF